MTESTVHNFILGHGQDIPAKATLFLLKRGDCVENEAGSTQPPEGQPGQALRFLALHFLARKLRLVLVLPPNSQWDNRLARSDVPVSEFMFLLPPWWEQ